MRPDLKPEIWLDDTEAEEGALECHLKPNRRVRVYSDDKDALMYVLQFVHFDASYLDNLIKYSEFTRTNIDFSLLNKLIALTKRSKVEPVRGHDGEFIYDNGKKKWRLETLGCRAEFGTEEDLARSLGRSRSHVIKHLNRMKQIEIITNSGHECGHGLERQSRAPDRVLKRIWTVGLHEDLARDSRRTHHHDGANHGRRSARAMAGINLHSQNPIGSASR
jgi:biotin operon repressor